MYTRWLFVWTWKFPISVEILVSLGVYICRFSWISVEKIQRDRCVPRKFISRNTKDTLPNDCACINSTVNHRNLTLIAVSIALSLLENLRCVKDENFKIRELRLTITILRTCKSYTYSKLPCQPSNTSKLETTQKFSLQTYVVRGNTESMQFHKQ